VTKTCPNEKRVCLLAREGRGGGGEDPSMGSLEFFNIGKSPPHLM
jgi:hypothetical protein